MPKKPRLSPISRRLTASKRDEIWQELLPLVGVPVGLAVSNDFWDPEKDVWFRPAKLFEGPDPGRLACETLIAFYKNLVDEEQKVTKAPPSSIIARFERIRNGLLKVAAEVENTSQAELRVVIQAAPKKAADIVREITPLKWPGPDGHSELSRALRHQAEGIDLLLNGMRTPLPDSAWADKSGGGRGRTILRHLNVAPAAWQLVHMTWRIFEDFGRPLPPTFDAKEFGRLLSYLHELATESSDADFDADVSRYMAVRPEFDALTTNLRAATTQLNLDNFFQLHEYIGRRAKSASPPDRILRLKRHVDRYVELRAVLTVGPTPREKKPSKKS